MIANPVKKIKQNQETAFNTTVIMVFVPGKIRSPFSVLTCATGTGKFRNQT
jgi:hypothetical protein